MFKIDARIIRKGKKVITLSHKWIRLPNKVEYNDIDERKNKNDERVTNQASGGGDKVARTLHESVFFGKC
ncbi:hypothetical protein PP707_05265 [Acetobacter pasteurianus]|nr:hypothetical protein [Acetobacter pasteurianus]